MFEALTHFFYITLYQPLFNSLVLIYNYMPGKDFGLAVILLTIIIKFIILPISIKAINSQKGLQKLQPKIQEIQKKYKDDKEKQAKGILELYKNEKINPFSGLLSAIIQIPILIALYQVFWNGLNPQELGGLYWFVNNPIQINTLFLNTIDLAKPNLIFAILAGITQYIQTKMIMPNNSPKTNQGKGADISNMMQKQMTYFFPFFTIIILLGLPSALGLYWIVSSIFSIIQQYLIFRKKSEILNEKV